MYNICQYYLVDSNNTQCIFASIIIFLRKYIIKLYSQEMKDETNERDLPTKKTMNVREPQGMLLDIALQK